MSKVIKKARPLKISKNIVPGNLVSMRGDKLIRCSKKSRPVGVYQAKTTQKIYKLDGEVATVDTPSGFVFYGHANILIGGKK